MLEKDIAHPKCLILREPFITSTQWYCDQVTAVWLDVAIVDGYVLSQICVFFFFLLFICLLFLSPTGISGRQIFVLVVHTSRTNFHWLWDLCCSYHLHPTLTQPQLFLYFSLFCPQTWRKGQEGVILLLLLQGENNKNLSIRYELRIPTYTQNTI